jgi:hypothetical protein
MKLYDESELRACRVIAWLGLPVALNGTSCDRSAPPVVKQSNTKRLFRDVRLISLISEKDDYSAAGLKKSLAILHKGAKIARSAPLGVGRKPDGESGLRY